MTVSITWPAFVEATDRMREATDALARLIADTLAVQFDGTAAYLVLEEDDDGDFMNLHSLLDADGRRLFEFGDDPAMLPALPQGSPLADAWVGLGPADTRTLFKAVQGLHQAGSLFDSLPSALPCDTSPGTPSACCCPPPRGPAAGTSAARTTRAWPAPTAHPRYATPTRFPLPIPPAPR
ncbi:hypothetical protein [Streptomyces avermitilis]|uniref:hypothetical protein n=1 Tax=Streptomyces avermitilis TaxID=33903 RepID=UPI0033A92F3C